MDKEYAEARRHEFNTVIDLNKDGKASIEELRSYVNPLNDNHVVEEVREIFEFADEDKDGYLTLKELLNRAEILISSGFIHPKSRLHDDL
jgi:Ca2+-binding EF-hand superfamily protein